MKHIFLVNTFSLKHKTTTMVKAIEEVCREEKIDYKIEVNSLEVSTEDIVNKYKNTKNIIIPIGGDGTINRVLNKIVDTKNILGYIPYGTGNDFYRTNKELLDSGINKVDLVKINDKFFINIACFGIDADIANNELGKVFKLFPEKQKYNLGLISNFLKYKPKEFEVDINNKTIKDKYTTIAVCNARYYGGGYRVSPNSTLNDGKLEVILVKKTNKVNMARLITSMKEALHLNSPKVNVIEADKLTIKSKKEVGANIDGEKYLSDIFEIELIPKGVDIYYNQDMIDKILKKV